MGKHADKVKSFDEFVAPWETEGGTDAEIDKPKLKRFIYNLKFGEAKALDSRDDALATVTTVETERDEAKAEAEKASPDEANKKIARLEKENGELKTERDGLVKDKEVSDLRAEVLEGVNPKHAKHVKGETREELEASLKEIREDFGIGDESGGDEDEDEDNVRTRPRPKLVNAGDKESGRGSDTVDFDKVADDILGTSVFR